MSKTLTIGSESFQYPVEGTKPGWGEEATDWATAATNAINNVFGPNDITTTCVVIANNQTCAQPVGGTGATSLSFSSTVVKSFVVTYAVTRTTSVETGQMEGIYNGTTWEFSNSSTGDAGVTFTITAAGQVQYFSTNNVAGSIKFRARTIDV